jgi:hypothetical protein
MLFSEHISVCCENHTKYSSSACRQHAEFLNVHCLKPSGHYTYVPPGLTFSISTFCPHSVFMCFVWIWEQTAIISLYSINLLVLITETERVYCAVRTEAYFNNHKNLKSLTSKFISILFFRFPWISSAPHQTISRYPLLMQPCQSYLNLLTLLPSRHKIQPKWSTDMTQSTSRHFTLLPTYF